MKPNRSEWRGFLLRLLVLLPAAYFVWYQLGPFFAWPVAQLSDLLCRWLFPEYVQRVLQDGAMLIVLVGKASGADPTLIHPGVPQPPPRGFPVYAPPLGAGMPLFLALALASSAPVRRHLVNLLAGTLGLLLGQTTSVMLKIGATLFSKIPSFRPSSVLCSVDCYWEILYFFQYFTYMILPTLLPILIWMILYFADVKNLIPGLRDNPERDNAGSVRKA